jgi:hypothetical protein
VRVYLPGEVIVSQDEYVQFEVIDIPVMSRLWLVSIQVKTTVPLSPQARVTLVTDCDTCVAIGLTVIMMVII